MLDQIEHADLNVSSLFVRPVDELLIDELVAAGSLDRDQLGPRPFRTDHVSSLLLEKLRSGRSETLYYVFCRMNSGPLVEWVGSGIRREGLPFDAHEVSAEVFARFLPRIQQGPPRTVQETYQELKQQSIEVLEGAIEDLLAYVPGAGLEPYFSARSARALQGEQIGRIRIHNQQVELSRTEYDILTARALLRLSLHDRRLLMGGVEPVEASESLSIAAARRRLQEELIRALQWLDLEADLLEESRMKMGRRTTS